MCCDGVDHDVVYCVVVLWYVVLRCVVVQLYIVMYYDVL